MPLAVNRIDFAHHGGIEAVRHKAGDDLARKRRIHRIVARRLLLLATTLGRVHPVGGLHPRFGAIENRVAVIDGEDRHEAIAEHFVLVVAHNDERIELRLRDGFLQPCDAGLLLGVARGDQFLRHQFTRIGRGGRQQVVERARLPLRIDERHAPVEILEIVPPVLEFSGQHDAMRRTECGHELRHANPP